MTIEHPQSKWAVKIAVELLPKRHKIYETTKIWNDFLGMITQVTPGS